MHLPLLGLPALENKAHYQVEDQQIGRNNAELFPPLIRFWPKPKRDKAKNPMRYEYSESEAIAATQKHFVMFLAMIAVLVNW